MTDRWTPVALFLAGVLAVAVGVFWMGGFALLLPVLAAAVAAGVVEGRAVRRTGRWRRALSWLPLAGGIVATVAVGVWFGPQGPDSGLALGIIAAGLAIAVPVVAAVTLGVAWFVQRGR